MRLSLASGVAVFLLVGAAMATSQTRLGCDGDATRDGVVNTDDILDVIASWGSVGGFDVDGDGMTGVPEILLVLEEWQRPCHPFHDNMVVTLDYAEGVAIITGSGLADHVMGPFDGSTGCHNPNTPTAQGDTWRHGWGYNPNHIENRGLPASIVRVPRLAVTAKGT